MQVDTVYWNVGLAHLALITDVEFDHLALQVLLSSWGSGTTSLPCKEKEGNPVSRKTPGKMLAWSPSG